MTDEQRRPEPTPAESQDEQHQVEDLTPDAETAENVKGGGWPYAANYTPVIKPTI